MSFMCLRSNGRRQTENGDGMSVGKRCLFSLINSAMWGNWSSSSALTGTSAIHRSKRPYHNAYLIVSSCMIIRLPLCRSYTGFWSMRQLNTNCMSVSVRLCTVLLHCSVWSEINTTEQLLNTYSPTRQLRSSGAGFLVKPETWNKTSDRAFAVTAATTWNWLPPKVRTATSTEQFSRALKTHLFTLDWSRGSPRCLALVISTDELWRQIQIKWLIENKHYNSIQVIRTFSPHWTNHVPGCAMQYTYYKYSQNIRQKNKRSSQ